MGGLPKERSKKSRGRRHVQEHKPATETDMDSNKLYSRQISEIRGRTQYIQLFNE